MPILSITRLNTNNLYNKHYYQFCSVSYSYVIINDNRNNIKKNKPDNPR